MATENWAILLSGLALVISIGVPIWQRQLANADAVRSKRILLLQRILGARSVAYLTSHELRAMIDRFGHKMEMQQKVNLEAQIPRLQKHAEDLNSMHLRWSNDEDGARVKDMVKQMALVDIIATDVEDMAKLIENGRRSYVDN